MQYNYTIANYYRTEVALQCSLEEEKSICEGYHLKPDSSILDL